MVTDDDPEALALRLIYPQTERRLRHLPRLASGAVSLVWRAARRELLVTLALQVVGSAALAVQVLAARELLSRLLAESSSKDFTSAIPFIVLLAVVLAVSSVVSILRTELQRLLSELVARFSMQQVIGAATAADLVRFESPEFHDRLQRAIINANIRPLQMTTGLLAVGGSLLGSVAVGATLLTIEPLFVVLGLVAVLPITLVSLRVGRALYRFAVDQTPTDRQRVYIQNLLVEKDPAKEIRAYGLAEFLGQRFNDLYAGRIRALRRLIRTRMVQGVVGGLLTAVITGGTLGLLILFVSDGRTSLAGAGAAAAALLLLGGQLQGLAGGVGSLYESALFIQDFNNFVQFLPSDRLEVGGGDTPAAVGRVVVDDLSFTYPSRTEPSLRQVGLVIEPGQVVALVGENGSGKTTLAKLLAGLYRPGSGVITWDGQDLASLDPDQARIRVAVLFQDFVRYFLSARENIAMGRWEHIGDHDGAVRAAQRSQAHRFIEELPRGYDTVLGPQFSGGSDLSGGQWQRMALARAFFRDAELIILDEPTAALDPRAEAALFTSVRQLFAGRSVVLISHRYASVRMADHIYVLGQGRVIEHGSHEGLMSEGGTYAELFTLQAQAFGLGPEGRAPDGPGIHDDTPDRLG
jgi:ATP-binding cassette, subfamily B, bacterial